MVGGYVQFGEEEKWKLASSVAKHPHKILAYVDAAIRNYYDKRQSVVDNQQITIPQLKDNSEKAKVSIAKLQFNMPDELNDDFYYMQQVMDDVYRKNLAHYEFIPKQLP